MRPPQRMDLPQGYPSGQSFNVPRVAADNLALLYASLTAPKDPLLPLTDYDRAWMKIAGIQP